MNILFMAINVKLITLTLYAEQFIYKHAIKLQNEYKCYITTTSVCTKQKILQIQTTISIEFGTSSTATMVFKAIEDKQYC